MKCSCCGGELRKRGTRSAHGVLKQRLNCSSCGKYSLTDITAPQSKPVLSDLERHAGGDWYLKRTHGSLYVVRDTKQQTGRRRYYLPKASYAHIKSDERALRAFITRLNLRRKRDASGYELRTGWVNEDLLGQYRTFLEDKITSLVQIESQVSYLRRYFLHWCILNINLTQRLGRL
jgi:hypothetical protein